MRNVGGNLCYLISVLQALLHAPKILNWLESHQDCFWENCLACVLRNLAAQYWRQAGAAEKSLGLDLEQRVLRARLADTERRSSLSSARDFTHVCQ